MGIRRMFKAVYDARLLQQVQEDCLMIYPYDCYVVVTTTGILFNDSSI